MGRTEASRAAPAPPPDPGDAELAVRRMTEMSPDLRGCAVLDTEGNELASSGGVGWAEAGRGLLAAADSADREPAIQVHVATEGGEAFAVRESGLAMVAVAERFTLASLILFDMRTILGDLAAGEGVPDRRAPGPAPAAGDSG